METSRLMTRRPKLRNTSSFRLDEWITTDRIFLWPRQIFNFLGVPSRRGFCAFLRRRRRRRTLRPRVTKTAHFLWRTRRGSNALLEGDCLKEEEEEDLWRLACLFLSFFVSSLCKLTETESRERAREVERLVFFFLEFATRLSTLRVSSLFFVWLRHVVEEK